MNLLNNMSPSPSGDVLVFVNDQCVLGYTHQDVVTMFQAIPIGQEVTLQVCRGYPLPFDPNDPNTEIVTTVAVTMPDNHLPNTTTNTPSYSNSSNHNHRDGEAPPPDYAGRHVKQQYSYGDMNNDDEGWGLDPSADSSSLGAGLLSSQPELLSIGITKGNLGFGFTIADSAYGQRVKQILDRPRCKNLQEGDILVEINGLKVKDMPHAAVVTVLKECDKGAESAVLIQRGGMLTPSRGRKPSGAKSVSG